MTFKESISSFFSFMDKSNVKILVIMQKHFESNQTFFPHEVFIIIGKVNLQTARASLAATPPTSLCTIKCTSAAQRQMYLTNGK